MPLPSAPNLQDVEKSCEDWQRWAESEAPEATPMPGEGSWVHLFAAQSSALHASNFLTRNSQPHAPTGQWASLTPFQRILVLRALKPDRLPAALAALCEATLGAK